MTIRCTVCAHDQRRLINADLRAGTMSLREIQTKYGVRKDALSRHRRFHLEGEQRTRPERKQRTHGLAVVSADDVLLPDRQEHRAIAPSGDEFVDEAKKLGATAWTLLGKAERTGDVRTAVGALREARGSSEYRARLSGRLDASSVSGQVLVMILPPVLPPAIGPKVIDITCEGDSSPAVPTPDSCGP